MQKQGKFRNCSYIQNDSPVEGPEVPEDFTKFNDNIYISISYDNMD